MLSLCVLSLFVLGLVNFVTGQATWAQCGSEKKTCYLPRADRKYAVRYGWSGGNALGQNPGYVLKEISGVTQIPCINEVFGDVVEDTDKKCAFKELSHIEPYSPDWIHCASPSGYCELPDADSAWRVRYGSSDSNLFYEIVAGGGLFCKPEIFGVVTRFAPTGCFYYKTPVDYSKGAWQLCAARGSNCSLPVADIFSTVKYGYATSDLHPKGQWVYRTVLGPSVLCDRPLFGRLYSKRGLAKWCHVISTSSFANITGRWQQVASCVNCTLSRTLIEGVTSTTSKSRTSTWTYSLSSTISAGFSFAGFTSSWSLTTGFSHAIAETMSSSLAKTATKQCAASCGGEGSWYMFQWILDADEACGYDNWCPFQTYACDYICRTIAKSPPCPLDACDPSDPSCQKCLPDFGTKISGK